MELQTATPTTGSGNPGIKSDIEGPPNLSDEPADMGYRVPKEHAESQTKAS